MKKLLLFSIVLLCALGAKAQKAQYLPFKIPYYNAPQKQDYANYKSYGLYVFSTSDDPAVTEAYYMLPDLDIVRDDVNADMKILVKITKVTKPQTYAKADTVFMTAELISADIQAYDKLGNKFYTKSYQAAPSKGYLLGDYRDKAKLEENQPLLSGDMIQRNLPNILRDFTDTYLLSTKWTEIDRTPLISCFTTLRRIPEAEEANDSVAVLRSAGSVSELKAYAERQLDYWKKLSELPQSKETAGYITCGNYNLALLYSILGNTEEAVKRADASGASKYGMDAFNKLRSQIALRSAYPVFEGPFVDPSDTPSTVSVADIVDSELYYVIPGAAYITLNDDSRISGKCKINKSNIHTPSQSGITSLNTPDYMVVVMTNTENKEVKFKLSQVMEITAGEDSYLHRKGTLLKRTVNGKVSLYQQVFPTEAPSIYFYKKADGKLETAPLIGSGKWHRQFFSDCPALVEKIANNQIKKPVDIANFYNKETE